MRRDPLAGKLPVTIVTGFLGSGKTTLIRQLLLHPDMNRVAVVINEMGEIGIDNDLVKMSSENVSLLANGCLCCVVRTDLQETLRELFGQRRAGQIANFDRLVIETSGMADPAPVIQTLVTDSMLNAHYRLDGVVTLVDAVNGLYQLETQFEAQKQAALADKILITKSDLTDEAQIQKLIMTLRDYNDRAPVMRVQMGEVSPSELIGLGLGSAKASEATLKFLGEHDHAHDHDHDHSHHDLLIRSVSLRFTEPFSWDSFSAALDMIIGLRGPDLLRVKGIVNVDGQPVVVQGVQHVMHPSVTLDRWPSDDRDTRIVFITRNIPEVAIRKLFDAALAMRG
jgi:G3E family GTPase